MDNFCAVNRQSSLLKLKLASFMPHHFATFLLNCVKLKRSTVNCFQSTCNPAPGKMAARCIPFAVFREPTGDMVARGAHNIPSARPHPIKMKNAQAAVLK
jgi:hypothetical protein